jgi:3D (Asp-Asp-Asp) domain-containing protein
LIIARSFWRKALVTVVAAVGFVSLYETTTLDSRYVARLALARDGAAPPAPGVRLPFSVTAYCKGMTTTAGVPVQSGVAAADPALLPVGSVIQLGGTSPRFDGIYTVMDTGPSVQGRQVDIYMWSCNEALQFGRKAARVTVLRLGWNPLATSPGFMDRLFRRPEPEPLPARPLPQAVH